jgi:hypothetical protein
VSSMLPRRVSARMAIERQIDWFPLFCIKIGGSVVNRISIHVDPHHASNGGYLQISVVASSP